MFRDLKRLRIFCAAHYLNLVKIFKNWQFDAPNRGQSFPFLEIVFISGYLKATKWSEWLNLERFDIFGYISWTSNNWFHTSFLYWDQNPSFYADFELFVYYHIDRLTECLDKFSYPEVHLYLSFSHRFPIVLDPHCLPEHSLERGPPWSLPYFVTPSFLHLLFLYPKVKIFDAVQML